MLLPGGAAVFSLRAERFTHLSAEPALGGFLSLMAALARAQAQTYGRRAAAPPSPDALAHSREFGMPPLAPETGEPDPAWREDLVDLLSRFEGDAGRLGGEVGGVTAAAVAALRELDEAALDELACRHLAGRATDAEAALVPFVGAALQVRFARAAAALNVRDVERCDVPGICPVCGMRPVASVVRAGAGLTGLRYLVCSLCQTEWHLPRIRCTSCDADRGLQYFGLEAGAGAPAANAAWRAEACDDCHSYLKIFYQDKDAGVDPVADDLASLSLDLMLSEQGYERSGPNLLFHPGSG